MSDDTEEEEEGDGEGTEAIIDEAEETDEEPENSEEE